MSFEKKGHPAMSNYDTPKSGLPAQTDIMTGRAVFTEACAVIPKGVMSKTVSRGEQRDDHAGRAIYELAVGGFGR